MAGMTSTATAAMVAALGPDACVRSVPILLQD